MKHTFDNAYPRKFLTDEEVGKLNEMMTWEDSGWNHWKKGETNTMNLEDCGARLGDIIHRCEIEINALKEHLKLYLRDYDIWLYSSPNRIKSLHNKHLDKDQVLEQIVEHKKLRCEFIKRFLKFEKEFFGEPMFIIAGGKKYSLRRPERCK